MLMMKQLIRIFSITILLFSLINDFTQAQDKYAKTTNGYGIAEKLKIDASDLNSLRITNKHGNITITGWERDTIEIHTLINVNAPGSNSAEEVLDFLSIQRAQQGDQLTFRTHFDKEFFSNYPFRVEYSVNLPSRLILDIQNNLGDVLIQNIKGQILLQLDYGKLHLVNSNNLSTHQFKLNFVDAKIDSCRSANANLNNCTLNAKSVTKLTCKSEYSLFNLKQVQSIDINSSTDRININQSDSVKITGNQLIVNCTELNQYGFFELNKGQLTVDAGNNLSQLSADNKMANTTLTLPSSYSYLLNGEVFKGQFTHPQSNQLQLIKEGNGVSFSGKIKSSGQRKGQIILFNENSDLTIKTR